VKEQRETYQKRCPTNSQGHVLREKSLDAEFAKFRIYKSGTFQGLPSGDTVEKVDRQISWETVPFSKDKPSKSAAIIRLEEQRSGFSISPGSGSTFSTVSG
jgi:hypothetical protein